MKRYTKEEDKLIIQLIRKYPNNLTTAFKIAGRKLGRTKIAVSEHWYYKLKKNSNCFVLSSDKSTVVNSKISNNSNTNKKYTKLQKFIMKLFKLN